MAGNGADKLILFYENVSVKFEPALMCWDINVLKAADTAELFCGQ